MPGKLRLLICQYYAREAQAALEAEGAADVRVSARVPLCAHPQALKAPIAPHEDSMLADDEEGVTVAACLPLRHLLVSGSVAPKNVLETDQCFFLLAPQPLVNLYLSQRAYIVTPGWLDGWRGHLDAQEIGRAHV